MFPMPYQMMVQVIANGHDSIREANVLIISLTAFMIALQLLAESQSESPRPVLLMPAHHGCSNYFLLSEIHFTSYCFTRYATPLLV